MASLQSLLEREGFGEVKTASVTNADELDRIAAELGLFDKTAEEEKHEEHEAKEDGKKEDKEHEKESSVGSLDALYSTMFPEDDALSKTAEEREQASYEQALGARAYDYLADRFGARVEKLAAEVLSGGATISASTAPDHDGNPHKDPTIAQAQQTNRPANASDKIDTSPVITDEIKKTNDARTVGDYEQKHAAIKSLALRKAFLLANLEA
jgi:hypothetical protein